MTTKKPTKLHLTDQFIRNVTPGNKRISYYDQHLIENNTLKKMGVKGLALRVTKAGSKSFVYRFWYDGKSKRYKVGDYPTISLSDAREKARDLAGKVNDGINPLAEKKARKNKPKPKKFEYLATQFKKLHFPKLKESTQKTYRERIDGELLPAFKGRAVKDISRGEIIALLEEIAHGRGKHTHSNRVRSILSSMFSFAVQRELAEFNPVKSIKPVGKKSTRNRVLTEDEIETLWEGFHIMLEPTGSLLKILLLLGQRKGETRRMKWNHIEDNVWEIPREETKADRKHFVPLPPLAIEIIKGLKSDAPFVFASKENEGKPIKWINGSFNRLSEKAKIKNIKIHDLRRTMATYMAELGIGRTILGKVLNHKGLAGDSQVTARYDRYSYMDEKRQALNRWSHKLQEIISGESETNVISIGN